MNPAAGSFGNGGKYAAPANTFNSNDFSDLNGLFSPSILQNASRSNSGDYVSHSSSMVPSTNGVAKRGSVSSANDQAHPVNGRQGSSTSINSPSSTMSHGALDSSCGTTPESSADSPDNRKSSEATLNTINEEAKGQNYIGGKRAFFDEWAKTCSNMVNPVPLMIEKSDTPLAPSNFVKSPATDVNSFNWMAQQNEGQFDPVLFGDYRDPQDNILNDFFSDAFPLGNDFGSPYNTGEFASPPPKKDLMQEIEVQKNGGSDIMVPGEQDKKMIGCDKIWLVPSRRSSKGLVLTTCSRPRIQALEKAQSGEIDMDNLCSELKKKAKCSGSGAVIDEKEVERILGPAISKPVTTMDEWLR